MQNYYIHRRQPPNGNLKGGSSSPGELGDESIGSLWVRDKLSEIHPGTVSNNRILGFHKKNSTKMTISIPLGKIKETRAYARHLAQAHSISSREIARFVGKASSMALEIPPAPLFYRGLQRAKNSVIHTPRGLDSPIPLDPPMKEELLRWLNQAQHWNGRLLKLPD